MGLQAYHKALPLYPVCLHRNNELTFIKLIKDKSIKKKTCHNRLCPHDFRYYRILLLPRSGFALSLPWLAQMWMSIVVLLRGISPLVSIHNRCPSMLMKWLNTIAYHHIIHSIPINLNKVSKNPVICTFNFSVTTSSVFAP